MSGGVYTDGYMHWHGFIEAAVALGIDDDFWPELRKINGMAWELHVRAHPDESNPGEYDALPEDQTRAVEKAWMSRTPEEIAVEFDHYATRPDEWLSSKP